MSIPPPGLDEQKLAADKAAGPPQLHGWKKALDTVGQIAAPNFEERIPGSVGNYKARIVQETTAAKNEQELARGHLADADTISQVGQRAAETPGSPQRATEAKTASDAETARQLAIRNATPAANEFELLQRQQPNATASELAKIENADKSPTSEFDLALKQNPGMTAPDYMKMQSDAARTGATLPEITAQIGERPAPGQKNSKGLTDEQWGQKAEAIKTNEANSAAGARGAAFGRNRPTQVLDAWNGNRPVIVSAGEAEDNPDRYVTQSGGTQALPKEALINDIKTSAQRVQQNLSVLSASGFNRAALAAALADPSTTVDSYMQAIPRGTLDDRGQQFVADLFNLREQAMAMRSVLGSSGGSEDTRRAILQTLPGIASNPQLAAKQLNDLYQDLDRLQQGVPAVPLAPASAGRNESSQQGSSQQSEPPGPPAAGMKWQRNSRTGEFRQVAAH
jgi:hypothetical protein